MDGTPSQQPVAVIGAPLDLGQDRRGVDMGPSAIRYAGLDQRLEEIGRDVRRLGERRHRRGGGGPGRRPSELRFLDAIKATCAQVAELVRASAERRAPCRSCSAATTPLRSARSAGLHDDMPGGVLWVDAHGDLNTPETSASGNVHGMVLAAALGLGGPRSSTTRGRCRPSIRRASRSSGSARSTSRSACCSASWARSSSR